MFDVGFSELVVIGIVALLVLGPQRLPEVARTAGRWMGRLRRLADEVKNLMFVFEDVNTLDDPSIQKVLREVDSKELALALKGVGEEVQNRIYKNMSERAAFATNPVHASKTRVRWTAGLSARWETQQIGKGFLIHTSIPKGVGSSRIKIPRSPKRAGSNRYTSFNFTEGWPATLMAIPSLK